MCIRYIFQSIIICGLRSTRKDRRDRGDCSRQHIIFLENNIDLLLSCVVYRTPTPFRHGTIIDQLRVCVGSDGRISWLSIIFFYDILSADKHF